MRGQDMLPDSHNDRYVCFVISPRAFYAGALNRAARPLASSQPIRLRRGRARRIARSLATATSVDRPRRTFEGPALQARDESHQCRLIIGRCSGQSTAPAYADSR
jgi:hypothetical protein